MTDVVVHVVTTGGPLNLENKIMWRNFYTADAPIIRKKIGPVRMYVIRGLRAKTAFFRPLFGKCRFSFLPIIFRVVLDLQALHLVALL